MTESFNTPPVQQFSHIATLQKEVYAWAETKGWTESPPSFGEAVALIHSEASEALEEYRVLGTQAYYILPGTAEPLPVANAQYGENKPLGVPSEFADIFIRLLHYCELFGVDLELEYEAKMKYNHTRSHRHGGKSL